MTTARQSYLNGRILHLCGPAGRLVPPRGMAPQAQNDELAALCRALDRAAPATAYEAWWSRFEDALMAGLTSRAWPMIADIVRVGNDLAKSDKPVTTGPAVKTNVSEFRREQLLRWCRGEGTCADFLITRSNLLALANEGLILHSEIDGMLAFAGVNHGITPEAERLRQQGLLPPSLMVPDTHEEIMETIAAAGARLRGQGVRNPNFGTSTRTEGF